MKKISKSNQPIEEQKIQEATDREKLARLLSRLMAGQEPGDSCTIILWSGGTFADGGKRKGIYTEKGWEYAEVQHSN